MKECEKPPAASVGVTHDDRSPMGENETGVLYTDNIPSTVVSSVK